jgi:hypothetical protein
MGRGVAYAMRRVAFGRRLSRLLPAGTCVRWQHQARHGAPPDLRAPATFTVPRPTRLEELLGRARQLAAGFRLVRVDLYQVGERVVFGS